MAIQVQEFRKYQKNSLQGFTTLLLTGAGLQIKDCTVHEGNGKRWISLPAKPYKDEEGQTKYSYIVSFPDKKVYGNFQKQALAALDEYLSHHDQRPAEIRDEDIPF